MGVPVHAIVPEPVTECCVGVENQTLSVLLCKQCMLLHAEASNSSFACSELTLKISSFGGNELSKSPSSTDISNV